MTLYLEVVSKVKVLLCCFYFEFLFFESVMNWLIKITHELF